MIISNGKKAMETETTMQLTEVLTVKDELLRAPLVMEPGKYSVTIQFDNERSRMMARDTENNESTLFLYRDTFIPKLHSVFEETVCELE